MCDRVSKRSREIDAWLQATGTPDDPAGRQAAVLATRRAKPEREHVRFDAVWKAEALAAGWGPEQAEALVATGAQRRTLESTKCGASRPSAFDGAVVDRLVDPEEWITSIAREFTERDSTFTRPQLVEAVAARLGVAQRVRTGTGR